jgi:hypothetical protein
VAKDVDAGVNHAWRATFGRPPRRRCGKSDFAAEHVRGSSTNKFADVLRGALAGFCGEFFHISSSATPCLACGFRQERQLVAWQIPRDVRESAGDPLRFTLAELRRRIEMAWRIGKFFLDHGADLLARHVVGEIHQCAIWHPDLWHRLT